MMFVSVRSGGMYVESGKCGGVNMKMVDDACIKI